MIIVIYFMKNSSHNFPATIACVIGIMVVGTVELARMGYQTYKTTRYIEQGNIEALFDDKQSSTTHIINVISDGSQNSDYCNVRSEKIVYVDIGLVGSEKMYLLAPKTFENQIKDAIHANKVVNIEYYTLKVKSDCKYITKIEVKK